MPEISRFYGISVRMYRDEHPPPHFHVRYGGSAGSFTIKPLTLYRGTLPPRIRGMIIEWAASHENELMRNWWLAQARRKPRHIPPLQ